MSNVEQKAIEQLLIALADDELILGHRDSEWTGHSPILEEDIAFSNIAQDEMGHALAFYTLHEQLTRKTPDQMGFEREWKEFRCCRFVSYPKGDFAYTVVRQFLYDIAEQVRLESLRSSSYAPLRELSEKMLLEEQYHILHSQSLLERLGNGTEESHRRMQLAATQAFPQALGMFEKLPNEDELVRSGVFPGNETLKQQWLQRVVPILASATLHVPATSGNGNYLVQCQSDDGGRTGNHTDHLKQLIDDMQSVYRMIPNAKW
jgi:ring-1,2-phenylacetyl-CoA epoxidase subunit PaaC